MKKINLLSILILLLISLISCDESTVNEPKEEQPIIEMYLIKDNGYSRQLPDTFFINKEYINLKYGYFSRENKWEFNELSDSSIEKISSIFEVINSMNVFELESTYPGDTTIADTGSYIFEFRTKNNTKKIDYKYPTLNAPKLTNFISQIDSIINLYKLNNPIK